MVVPASTIYSSLGAPCPAQPRESLLTCSAQKVRLADLIEGSTDTYPWPWPAPQSWLGGIVGLFTSNYRFIPSSQLPLESHTWHFMTLTTKHNSSLAAYAIRLSAVAYILFLFFGGRDGDHHQEVLLNFRQSFVHFQQPHFFRAFILMLSTYFTSHVTKYRPYDFLSSKFNISNFIP